MAKKGGTKMTPVNEDGTANGFTFTGSSKGGIRVTLVDDEGNPISISGGGTIGGGDEITNTNYNNTTKVITITTDKATWNIDISSLASELQAQIDDIVNGGYLKNAIYNNLTNTLILTKSDGTILNIPLGGSFSYDDFTLSGDIISLILSGQTKTIDLSTSTIGTDLNSLILNGYIKDVTEDTVNNKLIFTKNDNTTIEVPLGTTSAQNFKLTEDNGLTLDWNRTEFTTGWYNTPAGLIDVPGTAVGDGNEGIMFIAEESNTSRVIQYYNLRGSLGFRVFLLMKGTSALTDWIEVDLAPEKKHTFTGTAGTDGVITLDNGTTQDSTYDKDTIDSQIATKVNTTTFNLSQELQDNRITNVEEDLTELQLKLNSVILEQENAGPIALSTTPISILTFPTVVNAGKYNGAMRATWTGSGVRDVTLTIYINGVATSRTSTESYTDNQTASLFTSLPLDLVENDIVEVYASSTNGSVEAISGALQLVLSNGTIDLSAYETVADHNADMNNVNNRLDNVDTELDTKVSNVTFTTGQATQNTRISTNETNITTNTNAIATNTSDISGLDTRVTTNESDITDLQTKDVDLQTQIDNIEASRVFDYVVPTFADLPITAVDDELALVLSDANYSDLPTYYKWVTSAWVYQANYNRDYYTKAESDITNGTQDTNISTNTSAITDLDTRVDALEALPVASVFTESADDATAIADSTADPDGFYFVVEV